MHDQHCYKVIQSTRTWLEAGDYCIHLGGQLAEDCNELNAAASTDYKGILLIPRVESHQG